MKLPTTTRLSPLLLLISKLHVGVAPLAFARQISILVIVIPLVEVTPLAPVSTAMLSTI